MALTKIKKLRQAIEKLSKWEITGKAFGFIKTVNDNNEDYIYEFFCAMCILEDLKKNHIIQIKPSPSSNKYDFPLKPGLKKNYARFIILDKSNKPLLLCCLGVKVIISSSPKTSFAPDISFQTLRKTENPDERSIVLIMDAKYKQDKEKKIDISIIREFAQCVSDMNVPKTAKSKLEFNNLKALKANCLLTNGKPDENHELYCKKRKLKQVGQFDCNGIGPIVVG